MTRLFVSRLESPKHLLLVKIIVIIINHRARRKSASGMEADNFGTMYVPQHHGINQSTNTKGKVGAGGGGGGREGVA